MNIMPEYIIIHHSLTRDSGTVSWGAIRNYHVHHNGYLDIGYQFGIEMIKDYPETLLGRMMLVSGAHTKGMNNISIGVCFIGNFDLAPPSKFIWHRGIKLVRTLMDTFNIPVENVHGHRRHAGYKTCPGELFNMDDFRNDLGDISYG